MSRSPEEALIQAASYLAEMGINMRTNQLAATTSDQLPDKLIEAFQRVALPDLVTLFNNPHIPSELWMQILIRDNGGREMHRLVLPIVSLDRDVQEGTRPTTVQDASEVRTLMIGEMSTAESVEWFIASLAYLIASLNKPSLYDVILTDQKDLQVADYNAFLKLSEETLNTSTNNILSKGGRVVSALLEKQFNLIFPGLSRHEASDLLIKLTYTALDGTEQLVLFEHDPSQGTFVETNSDLVHNADGFAVQLCRLLETTAKPKTVKFTFSPKLRN